MCKVIRTKDFIKMAQQYGTEDGRTSTVKLSVRCDSGFSLGRETSGSQCVDGRCGPGSGELRHCLSGEGRQIHSLLRIQVDGASISLFILMLDNYQLVLGEHLSRNNQFLLISLGEILIIECHSREVAINWKDKYKENVFHILIVISSTDLEGGRAVVVVSVPLMFIIMNDYLQLVPEQDRVFRAQTFPSNLPRNS